MYRHSQDLPTDNGAAEPLVPTSRGWKKDAPSYNSALTASLWIQGFYLLLTALVLDGGRLHRCTWIAVLGQLCASWIILFRRPMKPSAIDLDVVKNGLKAKLVGVATFGWPLVQLIGLDR